MGTSPLRYVTNPSVVPGDIAELPYTEWGKKQWETYNPAKNGDYAGSCLPFGFLRIVYGPHRHDRPMEDAEGH